MVKKDFEWARQVGVDGVSRVNKATYGLFVGFLVSGFYVFGVQGRISGFMDLKYKQLSGLKEHAAFSRHFKTSSTHKLMIIVVPEVRYVSLWILTFDDFLFFLL
jgi:hypothetical protein